MNHTHKISLYRSSKKRSIVRCNFPFFFYLDSRHVVLCTKCTFFGYNECVLLAIYQMKKKRRKMFCSYSAFFPLFLSVYRIYVPIDSGCGMCVCAVQESSSVLPLLLFHFVVAVVVVLGVLFLSSFVSLNQHECEIWLNY